MALLKTVQQKYMHFNSFHVYDDNSIPAPFLDDSPIL